jgi:hypothetical protein
VQVVLIMEQPRELGEEDAQCPSRILHVAPKVAAASDY